MQDVAAPVQADFIWGEQHELPSWHGNQAISNTLLKS
jgi:hypothetical protein